MARGPRRNVQSRGKRSRPMWRACRWIAYGTTLFVSLCALGLLYVRFFEPPRTALQLQRWVESQSADELSAGDHQFVPLNEIAEHLAHAVIIAEDARFYEHDGVDWEGLKQAMEDNWRRGRMWRGGSTITQQLVKNLFLTTRGSVVRKVVEVPLAWLAEKILSKHRILELYLNVVEWGPGVYGAEAAAQHYYGISAARLSREQAARLAACLPAPRSRRPQQMNRSAATTLARMASVGW